MIHHFGKKTWEIGGAALWGVGKTEEWASPEYHYFPGSKDEREVLYPGTVPPEIEKSRILKKHGIVEGAKALI